MSDHDRLWTVKQVAEFYRLHPDTIRKWIRCEVLQVVRVGPAGEIRVPEREVTRLAAPPAQDDSGSS